MPRHTSTSTTTTKLRRIKPWPTPTVLSHGDYLQETYLESHIGGPLYENQSSLPALPIPNVQDTLQKFVSTALPLCTSDKEVQTLKQNVEDFPKQSLELQERLLHKQKEEQQGLGSEGRGKHENASWLQKWWNQGGYLQVRDPSVIFVSYFFHFADDATLPLPSPPPPTPTSSLARAERGIKRSAAILYATAEFRHLITTGSFPPETLGRPPKTTPLCSVAFKYMFHACRIPRLQADVYKMYDPARHGHAIVARRGRFYAVKIVEEDGGACSMGVLEERLRRVVQLADAATQENNKLELGWLTGSNRDEWAEAREEMLRVGGIPMEQALEKLESGAVLLCLDDEEPVSNQACAETFWHGLPTSATQTQTLNRWYDKSIQLICTNNGKAGLLGEHSMMDGMPVVNLANHVVNCTYEEACRKSQERFGCSEEGGSGYESGVEDVFEKVERVLCGEGSRVPLQVANAKQSLNNLISTHSLHVQRFHGYGATTIKHLGYSPDAYVQMAIQLATYRLFGGHQAATYEAIQTRRFLHGRTETARSVSMESWEFVKSMGRWPSSIKSKGEKVRLLQKAVDAHVQYTKWAAMGLGVDRHFLGLTLCSSDDTQNPALFQHPAYQTSKRWRVSTSNLTHDKFENWGFGEVVPDGVGVGYSVKKDGCVFNVTALKKHGWTDALCFLLEEALLEMRDLHNGDGGENLGGVPRSKL